MCVYGRYAPESMYTMEQRMSGVLIKQKQTSSQFFFSFSSVVYNIKDTRKFKETSTTTGKAKGLMSNDCRHAL